jgi:hypothetical protein
MAMNDMMTQTTAAIRMPVKATATADAHTSGLSNPRAAMAETAAIPPKTARTRMTGIR